MEFQKGVVNLYNPNAGKKSDMMFLPISLRDDQTTMGTGLTCIEFAIECGLIIAETKKGPWHLAPDYDKRHVFFFGDVASLVNYTRFVKQMTNNAGVSFQKSYKQGEVFRHALTRFHCFLGRWHYGMNTLVVHFKRFYGSFIQPICAELRIKRLSHDPTTTYQLGMYANRLIHGQVERILHDCFMESEAVADLYKNVRIISDDEFTKKPKYFQRQYRKLADKVIYNYNELFEKQLKQWTVCDDKVFVLMSNYLISWRGVAV